MRFFRWSKTLLEDSDSCTRARSTLQDCLEKFESDYPDSAMRLRCLKARLDTRKNNEALEVLYGVQIVRSLYDRVLRFAFRSV